MNSPECQTSGMNPFKRNGYSSFILHFIFSLISIFGLFAAPTVFAIEIDRALWREADNLSTVRGDEVEANTTVTIRYGTRMDNGAVIGTVQADGDGQWNLRVTNPDPVPCEVTALAGNDNHERSVRRVPSNCSNDATGVVDTALTASAGGPYTAAAGAEVTFHGTGSSHPDGTVVSYAWDFGAGRRVYMAWCRTYPLDTVTEIPGI